ncbi:MAG TPA: hypothetical protein DEG96_05025 [Candidatus Atribacteria bacterium]|nr:hypothetical protein [Candidatus Atribacteria bacterium]
MVEQIKGLIKEGNLKPFCSQATNNALFFRLIYQLKILLIKSGRIVLERGNWPKIALAQHYEIFKAINEKDVVKAEKAMFNRLDGIKKSTNYYI